MNKIKVSLIVPFYNVEAYIEDCIKSLINQDMLEMEIILVDDCSPDGSLAIAQKYAVKDSRIKIIRHEVNKHLGGARNTGLANAHGEYIWFIDSDDYLVDDSSIISNLYKQASESNADLIIFDIYRDREGKLKYVNALLGSPKLTGNRYYFNSSSSIANFLLNHYIGLAVWCNFYKRAFLQKNNCIFPENTTLEDNLNSLWRLQVESIIYLPKPYYVYRNRKNSIINSKVKENSYKNHITMINAVANLVDAKNWQSVYIGTRALFGLFLYTMPILKEFNMSNESHRQQMVEDMAKALHNASHVFNSAYFDAAVAFEHVNIPKHYSKADLINIINALKNSQDQENLKNTLYYSYVKLYEPKANKIKNIFRKLFSTK